MRWADLFEKFRVTQERARRHSGRASATSAAERDERRALEASSPPPVPEKEPAVTKGAEKAGASGQTAAGSTSRPPSGMAGQVAARAAPVAAAREKGRTGLNLGRFAGGGKKGKK
jgi:hypothetical protein